MTLSFADAAKHLAANRDLIRKMGTSYADAASALIAFGGACDANHEALRDALRGACRDIISVPDSTNVPSFNLERKREP